MIPNTFAELYVRALEDERRERHLQQPTPPRATPLWAQFATRVLVRAAEGLSGAQVRIEWPAPDRAENSL